ncbi:MAG: Gfo/Idh/MocA family oxidoreductase [Bacteroidetes bacterium]|nr:Gfo/Idh/MocA family oxidoreductase [Bacteroidota bacterium]
MNLGIIGLGYWGPNIVRNALTNKDINKVFCCDTDKDQLAKIKTSYSQVETVDNVETIFQNEEIDAVAIVTPVNTHYALAKAALEHGKHILVEKPFVASVEEAEEIIALAKEKNLITMVDHTFVYTPAIKKIKEVHDKGELGDIHYYDSVRVSLGLFQRDVNVIWDLGAHDFSIMNYIIGKPPKFLKAMGADHVGKGLEDVAYVHIEFENQLIAHFHLNWLSPVKIRKILIAGSKQMIVYDDIESSEKIKIYDKGIDVNSKEDEHKTLIQYRSGNMYSPALENTEALRSMIEEFVASVQEKREPLTSGQNGLEVVKLLQATQQSIKNNGEIVHL